MPLINKSKTFHLIYTVLSSSCLFLLPDSVGKWQPWSQWSVCSVSCGGGQQSRSRLCSSPPCSGLSHQSKTCNTQVCLGEFLFPVEYLYLWHQVYFKCRLQTNLVERHHLLFVRIFNEFHCVDFTMLCRGGLPSRQVIQGM